MLVDISEWKSVKREQIETCTCHVRPEFQFKCKYLDAQRNHAANLDFLVVLFLQMARMCYSKSH